MSANTELTPGTVIGNYEIVKTIARGGMGVVYLARHRFIKRDVALKVLFPNMTGDKVFTQRFQREGQEMAQLRHPNIVEVYDASVADGIYYLAIEYLPGGTLQQQLTSLHSNNLIMPVDQALQITRQIASALDYIHGKGLVHRDIKPSNILLAQDGRYVLADFGIVHDETSTTKLTRNLTTVGTPEYMSPEQAQGQKIDGRSDIYSLGIVLYEMLAGKPPFTADTPWETVSKHVKEPPPSITHSRTDLPGPAIIIVNKAIAKNPAERFQSGRELVAAIDKVLGQPAKAAGTAPGAGRLLLIGGVVVSLALIIGAVVLAASSLFGAGNATPASTATQVANIVSAATATATRRANATTTRRSTPTLGATVTLEQVANDNSTETPTPTIPASLTPAPSDTPAPSGTPAPTATSAPSATKAPAAVTATPAAGKAATPTPAAENTATPAGPTNVDFTLQNPTTGRENWGKPTSANGCSNFDNNAGIWLKYVINFDMVNTGPSDIPQYQPVFISSIKNVLPACVDLAGTAPLPAGSTTHIAYTLYMYGQYLQTIEVHAGSVTKRLCLDASGQIIAPC